LTTTGRTVSAFLIAPLAIPLVLCIGHVSMNHPAHYSIAGWIETLRIYAVFGLPVAYGVSLTFGIPLWSAYVLFNISSPLAFAVGGAVLGCIPALMIADPLGAWDKVMFALAGAVSGFLFGTMRRKRAPEPAEKAPVETRSEGKSGGAIPDGLVPPNSGQDIDLAGIAVEDLRRIRDMVEESLRELAVAERGSRGETAVQ